MNDRFSHSKSYLNSIKDNLYSLVLSEINRLICQYNLLISLDLSEISLLKNNSTDWIHSYKKTIYNKAFNLLKPILID